MHNFIGKWITDSEFFQLRSRNVFHRQLEILDLPCDLHRNRHILFRKAFNVCKNVKKSIIYISADDYYKLYINGKFVAQGPAPSYHFQYNYNEIDITNYLHAGNNIIAIHTLYQGLINRVWQSGDNRHGLIFDLLIDGEIVVSSDHSVKTAVHSAYREKGTVGYETQFLEEYDSRSKHVGFEKNDYDDNAWSFAKYCIYDDHILTKQQSYMLEFERILPRKLELTNNSFIFDFGSVYVGYLYLSVKGNAGDIVIVRCGQELEPNGTVRYHLRANCCYEENWILGHGESKLDWFDYKSFRYVEIILPNNSLIQDIALLARHYPFSLKARISPNYAKNDHLCRIWELCVNTQKYGVQEVIQDCMEREKGFYLGDGCYTALTNMVLTHDDTMVRKLIDDAFSTSVITPGLVTCLDCSFMQEIAEYPFMLVYLCLWHYRYTGDLYYLKANYPKITTLLDAYRENYESDYLLRNLDKWCVVEWPKNFQDNYDVDIEEGKICEEPHVSINAYYIEAIKTANKISMILGTTFYREESPLIAAFTRAFYCKNKCLFRDGVNTDHISIVGNVFPFAFGLCPNKECEDRIIALLFKKKISSLSLFCSFLALLGLIRCGKRDLISEMMLDKNAWLRIIREGSNTTFEGWGKDTKWNTSLFHLTLSYAAIYFAFNNVQP